LLMNIPANARIVKGWSPWTEAAACAQLRVGHVTCLLLVLSRGMHLVRMAFLPAPERLIRLFPRHQPWPRQVFASSLAVHALGFALLGWATRGQFGTAISTPPQQVSRAYAVRFLVLNRPPTRLNGPPTTPGRRPEHRPPRPVALARASAVPSGRVNVVESESPSAAQDPPQMPQQSALRPASLETEALAPGVTVGVGQIISTPRSDSTGGRGLVEPARHGLDRLPELVGGASSACPELGPPARTKPQSAVAVAFVVDTNGRVDRATLQVIESPGRPRTDHGFHARVYVVGASLRMDRGRSPPAADDSVLTEAVASHVAGLVFRPALREDRVIRSTVLVSCQTL
jgi:hypothetical protein